MPDAMIESLFGQACERWPGVEWPLESFRRHVGDDRPPHPSDLYLGGAAGHRVAVAWELIETEVGPESRRVLARQPLADSTPEDLWSETLVRLMDDETSLPCLETTGRHPAKIVRYRGMVSLVNYTIVVARRLAISRRRKLKPQLRLDHGDGDEDHTPAIADTSVLSGPEAAEEREAADAVVEALKRACAALSPEQQFLIAMVYRQGMKQKHAGRLLGWSEFKTSRQMSAAIEHLRDKLTELEGLDWTAGLTAAWQGAWAGEWESVQVPEPRASK